MEEARSRSADRGFPYGFHTSHTLPTRSGPGVNVESPGCQPDGVTSPVDTTCWNALTCLIVQNPQGREA